MKIKTISVIYGRKFNLDEYESMTVNFTAWADMEEGDDPESASVELWEFAKAQVKVQALPALQVRDKKRRELLSGVAEIIGK